MAVFGAVASDRAENNGMNGARFEHIDKTGWMYFWMIVLAIQTLGNTRAV
jgi:hypothetical protein